MRKTINAILAATLLFGGNLKALESVTAKFDKKPQDVEKVYKLEKMPDGAERLVIPIRDIGRDVDNIDIISDAFTAAKGEDGYIVAPTVGYGSIAYFKYDSGSNAMNTELPFYGIKTPRGTYLAIVKGLPLEYRVQVDVRGGKYKVYPRFRISRIEFDPYEDIVIDFYKLEGKDADYVGMAKKYRQYQLERGEVVPLKERVKNNPTLAYTVDSPFIRIKMAYNSRPKGLTDSNDPRWKGIKPEIKVVHTFDSFMDVMKKIHDLGVKEADVCFVGWQTGGFDGPFPDLFPVEEKLGGEAKMREAVNFGKSLGYHMTTHINNHNFYQHAKRWDPENVSKTADGKLRIYTVWPGGQAYHTCFQVICDRYIDEDIAHLKDMGMNAPQHVDVTSAIRPSPCCDIRHPNNRKQMADYQIKIGEKYHKAFGGFTSEAGFDHVAKVLDYALYTSSVTLAEHKKHRKLNLFEYETFPIWQIVYHGIILSNPEWNTIDCYFEPKGSYNRLKFIECGGRPTFYWTSYKRDLSPIKEAYDDYVKMRHLQYEFMDEHRELTQGVFLTGYSDGSEVVTNYSDKPFEYKGQSVPARDFKLFAPAPKAEKKDAQAATNKN